MCISVLSGVTLNEDLNALLSVYSCKKLKINETCLVQHLTSYVIHWERHRRIQWFS